MAWFWTQHGKTLKVVTEESETHPGFWDGPFATEAEALSDALAEYRGTASLYRDAIEDAGKRLRKVT